MKISFSELLGIGPRPDTFSYAALRTATDNFSPANKLGEGGFGPVYKVSCISSVRTTSDATHVTSDASWHVLIPAAAAAVANNWA